MAEQRDNVRTAVNLGLHGHCPLTAEQKTLECIEFTYVQWGIDSGTLWCTQNRSGELIKLTEDALPSLFFLCNSCCLRIKSGVCQRVGDRLIWESVREGMCLGKGLELMGLGWGWAEAGKRQGWASRCRGLTPLWTPRECGSGGRAAAESGAAGAKVARWLRGVGHLAGSPPGSLPSDSRFRRMLSLGGVHALEERVGLGPGRGCAAEPAALGELGRPRRPQPRAPLGPHRTEEPRPQTRAGRLPAARGCLRSRGAGDSAGTGSPPGGAGAAPAASPSPLPAAALPAPLARPGSLHTPQKSLLSPARPRPQPLPAPGSRSAGRLRRGAPGWKRAGRASATGRQAHGAFWKMLFRSSHKRPGIKTTEIPISRQWEKGRYQYFPLRWPRERCPNLTAEEKPNRPKMFEHVRALH